MRDILIILGMCLAAVGIGAILFIYGPQELAGTPPFDAGSLASTTPGATPDEDALAPQETAVPFAVIDSGLHAAEVTERANYAVYGTEEFTRLWKMAHGGDGVPVPEIDFSKEYVVGVFAGTKPTAGYGIRVASVTDTDAVRSVSVTLSAPAAGCIVAQALTNPYQLVRVPMSDLDLVREDHAEIIGCE